MPNLAVPDSIDIRQAVHPDMAKALDTEGLRKHFLVETLFVPGRIRMTYSHVDRLVLLGAEPGADPLPLPTPKAIGQKRFFDEREGGIINIGGPGHVEVSGQGYALHGAQALYIGRGAGEVRFISDTPADPARFYMVSAPAHRTIATRLIGQHDANRLDLGAQETANKRTIFQFLHPDVTETCQLSMGMTQLDPGNIWNTMPAHTHDRRSEAYLYFNMAPGARVFHLMGEAQETRHLVVGEAQAIISPPWSIHAGAGTSAYTFIWAMAGDNKDFTDMDHLKIEELK